MKLTDISLCTFCGEYEESLERLFLHCQFSKDFWMHTITWLKKFNIAKARLKKKHVRLYQRKITMDTPQPSRYDLKYQQRPSKELAHIYRIFSFEKDGIFSCHERGTTKKSESRTGIEPMNSRTPVGSRKKCCFLS